MTKARPPVGPEFTDFIAAARGPAELDFHGARFSVEAVILYGDGVRLDWLMKPMPDLSWLPSDGDKARRLATDEHGARPEFVAIGIMGQQLEALWSMSTLRDSAGVEFQLHQKRWTAMESRLVGELYGLGPQPPSHTGTMILSLSGVEYPIPISDTRRMAEGVDGFRGGDPGPKASVAFHDGAIKIISVLSYSDRVILQWLLHPVPDVSWVPLTEEQATGIADKPEHAAFLARHLKIENLWRTARMTDKRGTYYLATHAEAHTLKDGYRGEVTFRPGLATGAGELHLTMDVLSVFLQVTA